LATVQTQTAHISISSVYSFHYLFYYLFLRFLYSFCLLFFFFFSQLLQFPGGGPPGGLGLPGLAGGLGQRLDMPPVSMSLSSSRQEHLMSLASASAAAQESLTSSSQSDSLNFYA
jgi:hypothetical protein